MSKIDKKIAELDLTFTRKETGALAAKLIMRAIESTDKKSDLDDLVMTVVNLVKVRKAQLGVS